MIPKIIHYCWFGDKKMSSFERRCLDSWDKYLPGYSLKCWNELNFNVNHCNFTSVAYSQKKYAFVADVARLYALYQEGGVYLDTDMLFLKPLPDEYLSYDFFLGKEREDSLSAGILGSSINNLQVRKLLDYYLNIEFGKKEILIPHVLNQLVWNEGNLSNENKTPILILEPPIFYPLPYEKRHSDWRFWVSAQTIAVHLWEGSWIDYNVFELVKMRRFKRAFIRLISDFRKGQVDLIYLKRLVLILTKKL